MSRIRYEYKTLHDGRYHVITSPDMKGFYVTADSRDEVYAEADRVLALIDHHREADERARKRAVA